MARSTHRLIIAVTLLLDWDPLLVAHTVLGLAVLAAAFVAMAWRARQRAASREEATDIAPLSAPPSDWHDVTQRYDQVRIKALRDWMGEDHELVQSLNRETSAEATRTHRRVSNSSTSKPLCTPARPGSMNQVAGQAAHCVAYTDIPPSFRHDQLL